MSQVEFEPELAPAARRPDTQKLPAHLGLTRDEMTWAALAHASIVLMVLISIATGGIGGILGVAVPAIIWYAYRSKSAYVVDQARQATVFQLAGIVALLGVALLGAVLLVVGWVVTGLLSVAIVGLLLIPLMIVLTVLFVVVLVGLPIFQVVYGLYAAMEAYNGRPFRYRWIADLIDRYLAQS